MSQEEEIKNRKTPKCTLIAVIVIVLLIILGIMVMRNSDNTTLGGKWEATGGCACMPPK